MFILFSTIYVVSGEIFLLFLLLTVSAKVYYEQYFKSLFFFLISVAIIYPQISLLLKLYILVQETVLNLS